MAPPSMQIGVSFRSFPQPTPIWTRIWIGYPVAVEGDDFRTRLYPSMRRIRRGLHWDEQSTAAYHA